MERKKIIFLSEKNPYSKKEWSGIPYYMMLALKRRYIVEYVKVPSFQFIKKTGYYIGRVLKFLTGKELVFDYGLIHAWYASRAATQAIRHKEGFQFIFVPAGLSNIAFLQTRIPIVSVGDCSIIQLIDYYPSLTNVLSLSRKAIFKVEAKALSKVSLAVFSSTWANSFVSNTFEVRNTATIPFGANLVLPTISEARRLVEGSCNLLFVGVDWERKGGDTAIKILTGLLRMGIRAHLTILGSNPSKDIPGISEDSIRFIYNIDKDSQEGENTYASILKNSDFFILPTLADCTPIVIAEAFAFGIPVLASNTGGIPSMIQPDKNGFLLDINDEMGYINKIQQLLKDPLQYHLISQNCIHTHTTSLNWNTWADELAKLTPST